MAISVECDANAQAAREKLEQILGPATLVVASGGQWTDPATGGKHPRLHLHWRLREPAMGEDALAKLKRARELATHLVGGDTTNIPVNHPIRWPGGWHRKSDPVLARIVGGEDREVNLDDALVKLIGAAGNGKLAGNGYDETEHIPNKNPLAEDPALVPVALAAIPNNNLEWDEWNDIGLATWAATGGSEEGFKSFDAFSQKSIKYDATATRNRWNGITKHPPDRIGFGRLFHLAQEADPQCFDRYHNNAEAAVTRANATSSQQSPINDKAPGLQTDKAEKPLQSAPTAPAALVSSQLAASPNVHIAATPFVWVDPKEIPRRRWLYRPHYIRQFLSLTIATGGVGKSSLCVVESLAMVTGKPLLGNTPEAKLKVWWWNGEDPTDELQRRIVAAMKHHALTVDDIGERLFVDSGRTLPITIAEELRRGIQINDAVVEAIVATVREKQIDVLIVDPFVASHRVAENDNSAIERVAKSWSHVAEAANCAVMLVHHSRKTSSDGASVDDGRGASALLAAARSARTLNVMSPREAENAEIEERDRRLYFRGDLGKTNLTRPAEAADWFKLVSIELGNGTDPFDPGDEIGVVTSWNYPTVERPAVTVADIARAQASIKAGGPWRADQRAQREPWVGTPIAAALGLDLERKANRKAVADLVRDWLAADWLRRVESIESASRKTRGYVVVGKPAPVGMTGAPFDDKND